MTKLAIDGGEAVRTKPWPKRALITKLERDAIVEMFDRAVEEEFALNYNGEWEIAYEAAFVEFMGGGYVDAVNSGTNAVYVAIGALDLEPGDEVIIPPITDQGGAMPIAICGLVPVVAEGDRRHFNMSPEGLKAAITPRTKAVVVAHIAGEAADMDPIMQIAREHGLKVVEDCSQAHGALYKGKLVGTFGDVATFSTMSGKHHCSGGQGGLVYTRDEEIFWEARRFADRGKPFNRSGSNDRAGLNNNLNDIAACIGKVNLGRLPEILKGRRAFANGLKQGLKDCDAVSMGWEAPETQSAYWFIRLKFNAEAVEVSQDEFIQALKAEGIAVNPSYNHMPCDAEWFKNKRVFGKSGYPWNLPHYEGDRDPVYEIPEARKAVEDHFVLGIHENFGASELEDVVKAIKKVEEAYSAKLALS